MKNSTLIALLLMAFSSITVLTAKPVELGNKTDRLLRVRISKILGQDQYDLIQDVYVAPDATLPFSKEERVTINLPEKALRISVLGAAHEGQFGYYYGSANVDEEQSEDLRTLIVGKNAIEVKLEGKPDIVLPLRQMQRRQ